MEMQKQEQMTPSPSFRKLFAVGDIHGCYDRLHRLLEKLPFDREQDLLVFLGDYINRGPQSREVVAHLCSLAENGTRIIPLMGNHEYLLMEYQKAADPSLVPMLRHLQVEETLKSYNLKDLTGLHRLAGMPPRHREFFSGLRPCFMTDTHIFVHAGLYPGIPVAQQDFQSLYEMRGVFLQSDHDFGRVVVFGHTPFTTPLVTRTKIGIDTGAVYGNMLTALELPAMIFHHA